MGFLVNNMPTNQTTRLEVKGLIQVQKNLEGAIRDLRGAPFLNAMKDSTMKVQREAKLNLVGYQSPSVGGVDSGRTRASITPQIVQRSNEIQGVVGSNLMSAVIQEVGSKPHWPPIKALELWARRHGANAFLVARAISKRGNIARKFLSKALTSSQTYIFKRFDQAANEVTRKANGR